MQKGENCDRYLAWGQDNKGSRKEVTGKVDSKGGPSRCGEGQAPGEQRSSDEGAQRAPRQTKRLQDELGS